MVEGTFQEKLQWPISLLNNSAKFDHPQFYHSQSAGEVPSTSERKTQAMCLPVMW